MAVKAEAVINLTGSEMSTEAVEAIIEDARLMAGPCLDEVADDVADAAVKWLAAHLLASTSDTQAAALKSDTLGDASRTWQRPGGGDGLAATGYGQQAIYLLPCLARSSERRNVAWMQVM